MWQISLDVCLCLRANDCYAMRYEKSLTIPLRGKRAISWVLQRLAVDVPSRPARNKDNADKQQSHLLWCSFPISDLATTKDPEIVFKDATRSFPKMASRNHGGISVISIYSCIVTTGCGSLLTSILCQRNAAQTLQVTGPVRLVMCEFVNGKVTAAPGMRVPSFAEHFRFN